VKAFRRIASVVAACVVAIGIAAIPASPALAAGCYAGSCTGQDPNAQGCYPAQTLDYEVSGPSSPDNPGPTAIELRYAPSCYAAWARLVNGTSTGGEIWIESQGGTYKYSVILAGYLGEHKWTRMITYSLWVRACYKYWHRGFGIWVTDCTDWK
jgi:hypothetical protein